MTTLASASEQTKYTATAIEIGDGLDREGQVHGHRAATRQHLERAAKAGLGQHPGMQAGGQCPQLVERCRHLLLDITEQPVRTGVVEGGTPFGNHPRQAFQPPLGASAQPRFETAMLLVAGGDDSTPGGVQGGDLRPHFGLESGVH